MKLFFYDFVVFFQWGCMVASAIFSLRMIGNSRIALYIRGFYWYSVVAGLLALFTFSHQYLRYLSIVSLNTMLLIDDILLVFHFIFLSHFIFRVSRHQNVSKLIKILFYLFLLVILVCLFTNDLKQEFSAFAFANFGLVLFCCLYYFQIFEETPAINLLKEPSFWVVNGIFSCMCITIPVISLRGFFFVHGSKEMHASMIAVASFAYGVMHLFFIKAYLCAVKNSKEQYSN